jgi:hypothetical protein
MSNKVREAPGEVARTDLSKSANVRSHGASAEAVRLSAAVRELRPMLQFDNEPTQFRSLLERRARD